MENCISQSNALNSTLCDAINEYICILSQPVQYNNIPGRSDII